MSRLSLHLLAPSGASTDHVPVWNGTKWVPALPAERVLYDAKGDILIGSAADARGRLPVGSNGQVLTADSAETLGVKWATPAAGYADPLTTKGDLLGRSSSATARLPVGSDGQALIADSTQTLGIKWGAASGSVATDVIFDAKGDLPVGTGADAAARLPVGSNGQVLTADSAETTGVKWTTYSGMAFAGCQAVRSTTQSITLNVDAAISFTDADAYDTNSMHDTATNPTRITIPTGMTGVWHISAHAAWQSGDNTYRTIYLKKNGALLDLYRAGDKRAAITGEAMYHGVEADLSLTAGDYLEMFVVAGQTRTVQASMSLHRLS